MSGGDELGVNEEEGKEDGGGGVKSWGGELRGMELVRDDEEWQRRNLKGFIGKDCKVIYNYW